jgi:hypothetical protein
MVGVVMQVGSLTLTRARFAIEFVDVVRFIDASVGSCALGRNKCWLFSTLNLVALSPA